MLLLFLNFSFNICFRFDSVSKSENINLMEKSPKNERGWGWAGQLNECTAIAYIYIAW